MIICFYVVAFSLLTAFIMWKLKKKLKDVTSYLIIGTTFFGVFALVFYGSKVWYGPIVGLSLFLCTCISILFDKKTRNSRWAQVYWTCTTIFIIWWIVTLVIKLVNLN